MPDFGPDTDPSGGTRYSSNKPSNWWALPLAGLRLVARVTTYGGEKYAPLDWAIGQSFSVLYDCTMRHLVAMQVDGFWSNDEESGLPHAAHACWNLLTMCHFMALDRSDLDDVSKWRGVKAGLTPTAEGQYDAGSAPPVEVPPPASEHPLQGVSDSPPLVVPYFSRISDAERAAFLNHAAKMKAKLEEEAERAFHGLPAAYRGEEPVGMRPAQGKLRQRRPHPRTIRNMRDLGFGYEDGAWTRLAE